MREVLQSKVLAAPRFRYSQVVKAGPHYYCSGMLALDNDSGELIDGGPGEQALRILQNAGLLMEEFGLAWDDLLFVRVYTSQFDRFPEINAAWDKIFTRDITPPARTALGVSALPLGAAVLMEFTFYKDAAYLV